MNQPLVHLCGLVAYDGTEYHGFQLQRDVPTIQSALEEALFKVTGLPARIAGAGRTDAGVHARGQVIATRVAWRHQPADLQRAWNTLLPKTIAVRKLQRAPVGFHPRFSASARTYRYTVQESGEAGDLSAAKHSPLTDRFALFVTRRLDLSAMNRAAAYLVGEHDFATFGHSPEGETTVRRVEEAEWQAVTTDLPPLTSELGRRLVFTIRANAFLYQMVRNLVGTLLEVGLGHWAPGDIQAALEARDRSRSAPPVAAKGLVLERIEYPESLGLQFDS